MKYFLLLLGEVPGEWRLVGINTAATDLTRTVRL
jgi:hypothetical protein